MCLSWDRFSDSVIPIHVCIWNLRGLRGADTLCVTVRRETQYCIDDYRLPVVGEGGNVPRCN